MVTHATEVSATKKADWDIAKAEKGVKDAINNDSEVDLLVVLKQNSFLFYDLYVRKHGVQPIFHEVNFGAKLRCDFAWLNDNSSGPEWVIVEIEKPEMRLFTKSKKPAAELNSALEQVRSWDRYFKEHRDEARRIFGAVAKFRYILVAGSHQDWATEQASKWRVHHHTISDIEIKSMDTFLKSISAYKQNPQDMWSFDRTPSYTFVFRTGSLLARIWLHGSLAKSVVKLLTVLQNMKKTNLTENTVNQINLNVFFEEFTFHKK